MKPICTYHIVEAADPQWVEVWGRDCATGREWLVGLYDSRERAAELVKHWQETAT
jgi:hypothetical protein